MGLGLANPNPNPNPNPSPTLTLTMTLNLTLTLTLTPTLTLTLTLALTCSSSNASGEAGGRRAAPAAGERSSAVGDRRGDKARRGGLAAARPAEVSGCSGTGEAKRGAAVAASSSAAVGGGGGCERRVSVARESCSRKQMWRVKTARETRGATAASG